MHSKDSIAQTTFISKLGKNIPNEFCTFKPCTCIPKLNHLVKIFSIKSKHPCRAVTSRFGTGPKGHMNCENYQYLEKLGKIAHI